MLRSSSSRLHTALTALQVQQAACCNTAIDCKYRDKLTWHGNRRPTQVVHMPSGHIDRFMTSSSLVLALSQPARQ